MILNISICASSTAGISLWKEMLKEERKHRQKYHAVLANHRNSVIKSQNHKNRRIINHEITGWFGLEGTFQGHLVQPPAMNKNSFNQSIYTRCLLAKKIMGLNAAETVGFIGILAF